MRKREVNCDNSLWGISTRETRHAKAPRLQALLSRGISLAGAWQAATLPSCVYCAELQARCSKADDYVKTDSGKWRSLDGTRQFGVNQMTI